MTDAASLTTDDRLAIMELFARYAWCFDTFDVEGFLDCFAPDAVYDLPGGRRYLGSDQIRTYIEPATRNPVMYGRQHHIDQVMMQGNSQRATVRSYCWGSQRNTDGSVSITFLGRYADVCVKVAGRWLLAERVFRNWDPSELRG
jgi:uncharacterized protein (TIGR02246 family)